MADPRGFLNKKREKTVYRPVCERVKDYKEVAPVRSEETSKEQASRCMDCGTPFCNWACPVGNYIPEWNDYVYQGKWEKAFELLTATNYLPEVTGRVCPNPCEYACVLGINDDPITIRENELAVIEYAFKHGVIKAKPPKVRTGKKVAVIGSGPAGLACAAELNRFGHQVTVFERDQKLGGLMRYGIPDFKLEKEILDRRIKIWQEEGIEFKANTNVVEAPKGFDAICLTGGSKVPRNLPIPGRDLKGIYFAMEYLGQNNRRVSGEKFSEEVIDAKGKKVVVIGGGDTGSDCVGTANRQGAACVVQIELLPKPSEDRPDNQPWPSYPFILKTTSSHEEGAERKWAVLTKEFKAKGKGRGRGEEKGKGKAEVGSLCCVQVEFEALPAGRQGRKMKEIPGSEFCIEADLVLLAMGFVHPEHDGLLDKLKVSYDQRGNVKADNYQTSVKKVFAAGDMRRGQSLIVWALAEGKAAAEAIDNFLKK